MWDILEIRTEHLDRLGIEVDGGEAFEPRAFQAQGKAAAAAEEIEKSWGVAHGELRVDGTST